MSNLSFLKYVEEEVVRFYCEVVRKGFIRGCFIEVVIVVCVYVVCRFLKVLRIFDEIVDVFCVDKKEIGRSFCFIVRYLNFILKKFFVKFMDYVNKFVDELGFSEKVRRRVIEIFEEVY